MFRTDFLMIRSTSFPMVLIEVTVQPAPFAKPHSVLTAAMPHLCSYADAQLIGEDRDRLLCRHNSVPALPDG